MKLPELPPLPSFDDWEPDEEFVKAVLRGFAWAYGEMVREECARVCDEINTESGGGFETFAEAIREKTP